MTDPTDDFNDLPDDALDAEAAELHDADLGVDVDEFADELPAATEAQLTPDGEGATFFDAGVDLHALDDLALAGRTPVLERLGPAHFRSKGFSFMGFLQTVYDHVAEEVAGGAKGNAETTSKSEQNSPQEPI